MLNHLKSSALLAALSLALSCTSSWMEVPEKEFYATLESAEADTRVYAGEDLQVYWTTNDRVGIFDRSTRQDEYRYDGRTGSTSGAFKLVNEGSGSGTAVQSVYAVYPYKSSTTLSPSGAISLELSAYQNYIAGSFGQQANAMAAVSSSTSLPFRNLCGYLVIKLTGEVSVSSLSLEGNNGEMLAGTALVRFNSGIPSVTISSSGGSTRLNLRCPSPVALSPSTPTEFWFVVPPVSFQRGFTLTVTASDGSSFTKITNNTIHIRRNTLSRMASVAFESGVSGAAEIWTTTFDRSKDFAYTTVPLENVSSVSGNLTYLTSQEFQTIDGFGLAVTQASCYNLLKMSPSDRTQVLKELFSPTEGAGSSLIRVCIGGSDFAMSEYTWCDSEGIANFAVHGSEYQYLFPVLDEIYRINPEVQILGSPWSCPRWMKMGVDGSGTHYGWTSGRLNPNYYGDYATYLGKWVQTMQGRGYKVLGITIQNEPLNQGNSMSLYMPWEDQRDFLRTLGPVFSMMGLSSVKLIVYDHNYNYDNRSDQRNYPLRIYADEGASQYAAGSAWHGYGGSVSELDNVHSSAPDKGIWFTEASIGSWNYGARGFGELLDEDFREIVLGTLSRYCRGITLWNLMLDEGGNPHRPGGCSTCYGALSVSPSTYSLASVDRKSHWYDVAHPSVVIRPGAVRIGTSGHSIYGVTYQAFRNPDGSYGVLLLNETWSDQKMTFSIGRTAVPVSLPARSVVSVRWKE